MRLNRKQNGCPLWIGCGVLLLAMALHLLVNIQITVYSDDYWYGTFFQDGLAGFLRNTVSHYLTNNGRVYVHILIPILLLFDTKLFALLSPVLTALIFLLALRVQDKSVRGGTLLLGAGMGLLSLLGSEIQYLRMALYWLSAYFNYAFPLLFPLLVLWGMERVQEEKCSRLGFAALCLNAVLAGAGTEQCGLVSLILVTGWWLLRAWRREPAKKGLCLFPLLTATGYLTILCAPGSHARMARGIDGGIFSALHPAVFAERFFDVMGYLCGYEYWNLLFAVFCLLTALVCLTDRSLPRHLLSGFPVAGMVLLLSVLGLERPLAVLTVLFTLYLAVTLLFFPEYQTTGLLLLGAGASVMMLVITTLYYARTFFPCLILLLAVCWSLLFRLLPKCYGPAAAGALIGLGVVFLARYLPIYQGYAANREVVDRNLQAIEAARTEGELTLSVDLEADYRFTMFFEGHYFLSNFLRYYGLPQDIPLRFTSEIWDVSGLRVGERESTFPALEKDGELLIPIEFLFQAAGGVCEFHWTDYTFFISFRGWDYTLYEDGRLVQHLPSGEQRVVDSGCVPRMPYSYTYTLLYLPAEDFQRCFGIVFDYDEENDCYVYRETVAEG